MLSYEEMQYLSAFSELGTLSEVAEKHHISQPTITRAMKKAEAEFGVPLFERTKNSIRLNDNGIFATKEITLIIKQLEDMLMHVRAYDRAHRTISIGSAAAVQLPDLIRILTEVQPEYTISTELKKPEELLRGLETNIYQLVILPYQSKNPEYLCAKIGEEHLMFSLPKIHKFARRNSLFLSELNGENMLLFSEIGFWANIVKEKMPDSRFLVQNERYSFQELITNSILPCFTSDLAYQLSQEENRVAIPISDDEVNVNYYVVCKKENRTLFSCFTK